MAVPSLVTTLGSASANSYISLSDADSYFEARLRVTAWQEATSDDRIRALLMAAKRLNQMNWRGSRVDSTQALAWPRIDVPKRDGIPFTAEWPGGYGTNYAYSDTYDTDEIPQVVKDAQCEMALELLDGWDEGESAEIASFSADGVSVSYRSNKTAGAPPAKVSHLLDGLLASPRLIRA